jgi:adenine-specific DNA-methyltransferase
VRGFTKAAVTAFELDKNEAAKATGRARQAGLGNVSVHAADFLAWAVAHIGDETTRFEAVLGNPPFVRYQYLPEPFQERAEEVFNQLRLPFTKHTNAWVPFILASLALLRPGGRLAMVVPAEIIHVMHAQSLRSYLGRECRRLVVIDPEEIWFSDTLQGAVLLLAEKRRDKADKAEGLGIFPVKGREFLDLDPADVFATPRAINGKTVEGKWTRAILGPETRELFDQLAGHPEVHRFEDVAQVDVGIVTGANKYFLVTDDVVRRFHLERWAHPMFGRSEHCPGIIYDKRQHEANARAGNPTNFLWLQGEAIRDSAARAYIKQGEAQTLHTRYKCRVRSPWYTVPSVYSTEVGMLKRAHDTPRLILNRLGAYTTDTAYRIRARQADAERLISSNSTPTTAGATTAALPLDTGVAAFGTVFFAAATGFFSGGTFSLMRGTVSLPPPLAVVAGRGGGIAISSTNRPLACNLSSCAPELIFKTWAGYSLGRTSNRASIASTTALSFGSDKSKSNATPASILLWRPPSVRLALPMTSRPSRSKLGV